MAASSEAPARAIEVPTATVEPKRGWFLSMVLALGMLSAPLRVVAHVVGTEPARAITSSATIGIAIEVIGFVVVLGVWRWRKWAVLAWIAATCLALVSGVATGSNMDVAQGVIQGAIISFCVIPIWSSFR